MILNEIKRWEFESTNDANDANDREFVDETEIERSLLKESVELDCEAVVSVVMIFSKERIIFVNVDLFVTHSADQNRVDSIDWLRVRSLLLLFLSNEDNQNVNTNISAAVSFT